MDNLIRICMRFKFMMLIIMCGVMVLSAFTPLSTSGCGTTKTCFFSPLNCNPTTNCAYYTAWKIASNPSYLDVEIAGITSGPNDYIAIGFSDDKFMGADGVTACHYTGSTINFWSGHTNSPKSNSPRVVTINPSANFINTSSPEDGGSYTASSKVLQCRFKRLLVPSNVQLKNLKTATYYVMFARGGYTGELKYHSDNKFVSLVKYNVLTVTKGAITPSTNLSQTFTPVTSAECGVSKSCYKASDGAFLSWKPVGSMIEIEMSGKLPSASGYIAIGISSDAIMGNDGVLACIASPAGTVTSRVAYNIAGSKSNNFIIDFPSNFLVISASGNILGGSYTASTSMITCRIRRQINPTQNTDQLKNITRPMKYHIMMSRSNRVSGAGLGKHLTGLVSVSSTSVDLSSTNYVILGSQSYALAKTHGCLMILAWLLCAPIAIMLAHHFKPLFPDERLCGEKVWFQFHRAMAVSCLLLTLIAFILIFVEAKGYTTERSLPYGAHPILGIIVTALCVINPIMALFRPAPTAEKRPIFNWAHRIVGVLALILSIPTIFIGFRMRKAGNILPTMNTPLWILIGVIAFGLIIKICFMIADRRTKVVSGSSDAVEMRTNEEKSYGGIVNTMDKKEKWFKIIMIIYIIGLLAFVISLISLIAVY